MLGPDEFCCRADRASPKERAKNVIIHLVAESFGVSDAAAEQVAIAITDRLRRDGIEFSLAAPGGPGARRTEPGQELF